MLHAFLVQGLAESIGNAMFLTASLTIGTSTITVARNTAMRTMPFDLGGEDPKTVCTVLANAADVTAISTVARNLIGSIATMDSQEWRISDVETGTAGVRILLKEPGE
jgi:hypothetical protein